MIYLTSDLHFNHDKEFLYVPRGFKNIEDMNNTIIQNFNSIISYDDDVYILGDLMLGGADKHEEGLELISALNGKLHLVRGNHDTDKRWAAYKSLPNVVEMENAIYLKYNGYHFYMSHFPTMTANLEKETLKQCTINLFGHTHQKTNFYNEIPFMYHVGVDSHNCMPVCLDDAIKEMKYKVKECLEIV
jgi:calcineurin-like phosphoesterase family protein